MKIWTVCKGDPYCSVESFATEELALKRAIQWIENHLISYDGTLPRPALQAFKKLIELEQYSIALELFRHFKRVIDVLPSELTGHVME